MFVMGIVGAGLLLSLAIKDRVDLHGRNGVLRASADSTISDAVLMLLCALGGLGASLFAWWAQPVWALASLIALGLVFNVLILNMLRGRRAVTRSMRLTIDKLTDVKKRAQA